MRSKQLFVIGSFSVLASFSALACEVRAGAGPSSPSSPPPQQPAPQQPVASSPAPVSNTPPPPATGQSTHALVGSTGGGTTGNSAPVTPTPGARALRLNAGSGFKQNRVLTAGGGGAATPTSPTPTVAGNPPVMSGKNAFGSGTPDPAGWTAAVYFLPKGSTAIPALSSMKPNGIFYASSVNTSLRLFPEGFPGIDATRKEDFAIHYEAHLVVDNEGDYDFKLGADDGAFLEIDGMKVLDNSGVHPWGERATVVHLVKGTHTIEVDYMQVGGTVGVQLSCNKTGTASQICPLKL